MQTGNFDIEAIQGAAEAINQLAEAIEEARVELNTKVDQKILEDNQGDVAESAFKPQYDTDVNKELENEVELTRGYATVGNNAADSFEGSANSVMNSIGGGF